jgi:hypothetical protein
MNNLLTEFKTTSIGHAGPETDTNTRPENYHKSHHIRAIDVICAPGSLLMLIDNVHVRALSELPNE